MKEQAKPKKISLRNVVITSFIVDISDVVINIIIAVISGSVVMLSQALEGGADLIASGLLIIGLERSKKPSDKTHPFGHGRELYFWTFLSALVTMLFTAGLSFYFGYERFTNPQEIENVNLALLVLLIAMFTNGYSFSLSYRRLIGKNKISDILSVFSYSTFIETKTTFILDLMGTIASILGMAALVIFALTNNSRFDGLGAMAIGVTLGILSLLLLKGVKDLIVGKSASKKTEKQIESIALADKNVKSVLDLRTMIIGPDRILVNLEVHLQDELTTDEIEKLIDKIKADVSSQIPTVTHIQIELETPDVELKK